MWTLAIAAALAAAPSPPRAPAAIAAVAPGAERDWNEPPAGTPEDQRLWRQLHEGNGSATLHLARVAQCAYRIRYGRYYEALDARPGDAGAAAARTALADAAQAAQGAIPERPGLYACRRVLLDLDQRIELPRDFKDGDQVRREARDCVARMARLAAAVEPEADRLEAALARVDEVLGRARPSAPAGGSAAAPDDAGAALRGAAR